MSDDINQPERRQRKVGEGQPETIAAERRGSAKDGIPSGTRDPAAPTNLDAIIKRLREAIAAGPTKGRWVAHLGGAGTVYSMAGNFRRGVCVHQSVCIAPTSRHDRTVSHVDMAYIAAASPDNIAALLDRLDEAREAARTWENEAERRSRRYEECAVKLDKAERENERLRSESKAQLEELDRIDDALGTNEGPSAVDHIVILKTENGRLREDAERYRWLTDDHPKWETRERVSDIAFRISVSGKGHIDAAIDAARAAERGEE